MSAPFTKGGLRFTVSDQMSVAGAAPVTRPGLTARLRAALHFILELPYRRAVYRELEALSDHELADIALSRCDIRRVFDPRFLAERSAAARAA